jgi:hypothetical protein
MPQSIHPLICALYSKRERVTAEPGPLIYHPADLALITNNSSQSLDAWSQIPKTIDGPARSTYFRKPARHPSHSDNGGKPGNTLCLSGSLFESSKDPSVTCWLVMVISEERVHHRKPFE